MTGLDDRQKAFENKFKHDEEVTFKVMTRRARLLGMWAAEQMGMTGSDASDYAKTVVMADMEEAGHADLIRKIKGDFTDRDLDFSDHRIEKKMEEFLSIAKQQVMDGK
ncbi:MAG: DUF1476 family protein [Alphaproteobacteria bacterium]|nr:DUF1476 family protein [Alphaproteobacteria bacterium]